MLIAVYGSLREGLHNHHVLKDKKGVTYMGKFETKPRYTLKSLGEFPALVKGGHTSIVMEVYRVDKDTTAKINDLEGYKGPNDESNMYNRETMSTPFGNASTYIFNGELKKEETCNTGDWKEFLITKKINQNV